MRLKIRHVTTSVWESPPDSVITALKVTPRSGGGQFVRNWRVEIDADARLDRSQDAYGNIVHWVFVEGPVERLAITLEGEVDTTDTDGIVAGVLERQPRALFLRETPLTAAGRDVREFAVRLRSGEGGDTLAALHAITRELHETFELQPAVGAALSDLAPGNRSDGPVTTLAARTGSRRDLAHLFIAAARALEAPARLIEGYVLAETEADEGAEPAEPAEPAASRHTWAEAYVAGIGWIGFDAMHGLCVTDRYVRVSVGADALEAAFVRTAQVGGGEPLTTCEIAAVKGREIVEA